MIYNSIDMIQNYFRLHQAVPEYDVTPLEVCFSWHYWHFRQRTASVLTADIVHSILTGPTGDKHKETAETRQFGVEHSFKISCFWDNFSDTLCLSQTWLPQKYCKPWMPEQVVCFLSFLALLWSYLVSLPANPSNAIFFSGLLWGWRLHY